MSGIFEGLMAAMSTTAGSTAAGTAAAGTAGSAGAAAAGGLTAAEEAAALAASEGGAAASSSEAMLPAAQGASMAVQGNSGGAMPFLMKAAMAGNSKTPLTEGPSPAPMIMSPFSFSQGTHPILTETSQGLEDTMAPGISDNNAMPLFKYQPPANSPLAGQNLDTNAWKYQPANMGVTGVPPPVSPTMASPKACSRSPRPHPSRRPWDRPPMSPRRCCSANRAAPPRP